MKKLIFVFGFMLLISVSASAQSKKGEVKVKGHTTKDGTYVPPHTRTKPNKTEKDNWSTKGNTNPHTGKKGTKKAKKYEGLLDPKY